MQANSKITVWHFDEDSQEYSRRNICGVYVDITERISKNGIKQKGFFDAKILRVRIPTTKEISVCPGDYVRVGVHNEDEPKKMFCFKVNEVKDNRRGGQPHWRISCGG